MATQRTVSVRVYWIIFATLLALTAATVAAAEVPLGRWHTPAAIAIAATKATLVVLFFMHALHSSRLTWIVIGGALFWLGIMMTLILADYFTRSWATY